MNTIYKTIFNRALGVWQAVSELVKSAGKSKVIDNHPPVIANDNGAGGAGGQRGDALAGHALPGCLSV